MLGISHHLSTLLCPALCARKSVWTTWNPNHWFLKSSAHCGAWARNQREPEEWCQGILFPTPLLPGSAYLLEWRTLLLSCWPSLHDSRLLDPSNFFQFLRPLVGGERSTISSPESLAHTLKIVCTWALLWSICFLWRSWGTHSTKCKFTSILPVPFVSSGA